MSSKPLVILAALAMLAPLPVFAQSQCREFGDPKVIGSLTDSTLDEASGLAKSWTNPEIFWTHNDSGDSARVFAISASGATVGTFTLATPARDWEDIAVGPCGAADPTPCVYVGDIGDNNAVYPHVLIHRFREPIVDGTTQPVQAIDEFDTFELTYDGGARNAETLMVDPTDATVYLIDKTDFDPNNLYRAKLGATTVFEQVVTFSLGEEGPRSGRITGGEIAPNGTEVSIRTYDFVYTFCGTGVIDAFSHAPSTVAGYALVQSETLTYSRDGSTLYTTSERDGTQPNAAPPLVSLTTSAAMGLDPAPTRDMGRARPDASVAPSRDSGAARGSDTSIRRIDKEASPGCTSAIANGVDAAPILLLGAFFARRGRRRREKV